MIYYQIVLKIQNLLLKNKLYQVLFKNIKYKKYFYLKLVVNKITFLLFFIILAIFILVLNYYYYIFDINNSFLIKKFCLN